MEHTKENQKNEQDIKLQNTATRARGVKTHNTLDIGSQLP